MKISVSIKIVGVSVGIILLLFAAFIYYFSKEFDRLYPEFLTSHSTAVAQMISYALEFETVETVEQLQQLSDELTPLCQWITRTSQDQVMPVQVAVLDPTGRIIAHPQPERIGQIIESSAVQFNLGWYRIVTFRDQQTYHTFIPIFNAEEKYLGAIDVAYAESGQDDIFQVFRGKALQIFPPLLIVAALLMLLVVYLMISRPLNYLIRIGDRMAQGHLVQKIHFGSRSDELARLASVFVSLSAYLQDLTDLATQIASGNIEHQQVQKRSKRDVLGYALQEMLHYLQTVASGASHISEGDLTMVIPLRTDQDQFGRALQHMMQYLHEMAGAATTIAKGDLRNNITPRSERDVLGNAFAHMTAYLQRLATAASAIAGGQLQQKVQPESEHDVLGNAFQTMAVQLRENFEKIQQEVAERKQAQEALAKERNLLQTLINSLPDAIYVKDTDLRFLMANPSLLELMGAPSDEALLGKTDRDFYPAELVERYVADDRSVIATGEAIINREEPVINQTTGVKGWQLTTKVPLRNAQGQVSGLVGITKDITEVRRMQQENMRMGAELNVARQLQEMMLPRPRELQQIAGIDLAGFMQPADEVGGDYYDIFSSRPGEFYLAVGDVTGHGLESGVLMLMTQTAVRTLIDHDETNPVALLNSVNRTIYHNIQRMNVDKSLTFAFLAYQEGRMTLAGQHEELLLVRRDGQVERIDTIDLGFPVGLQENIAAYVSTTSFTLQPGDGIVLYTDGVTEAENAAGELYGLDRLCTAVSRTWPQSADAIQQAVIADVTRFIGDHTVYDDLTLVVLKQM